MRKLILIRGLPGSGKTTFAQQIAKTYYEADMFFEKDGTYQYDREQLGKAHDWCKDNVKTAMMFEEPIIAVSNTFVKRWEMQDYYDLAATYGYCVTEITMSGKVRDSVHKVPAENIERMRLNWER